MCIALNRLGLTPEEGKAQRRILTQCCHDHRAYTLPNAKVRHKPTPKIKMSMMEYRRLMRTRFNDGECSRCSHYPNPILSVDTDQGPKRVVVCRQCKHKMLPYR